MDCTIYVVKIKGADQLHGFITDAKSMFSHDAAHLVSTKSHIIYLTTSSYN